MRLGVPQNAERGGSERRQFADLYSTYPRISDHCMVKVRVTVRVRVRVADTCIQTAGESVNVRINHVIKTDQWRDLLADPPRPAFSRVPRLPHD